MKTKKIDQLSNKLGRKANRYYERAEQIYEVLGNLEKFKNESTLATRLALNHARCSSSKVKGFAYDFCRLGGYQIEHIRDYAYRGDPLCLAIVEAFDKGQEGFYRFKNPVYAFSDQLIVKIYNRTLTEQEYFDYLEGKKPLLKETYDFSSRVSEARLNPRNK